MAIGDLLFSLFGQPNPRDQLAMSFGQYPGQAGSGSGPVPGPGAGAAAPGLAAKSAGQPLPINNGGAAPVEPAPQEPLRQPEPQAYQSPNDMTGLYLKLMDRAYANASIDRGFGLLAAGLSNSTADRQIMVDAMSHGGAYGGGYGGGNIGQQLMDLTTMTMNAQKLGMMRQTVQNLPMIARQLNMPLAQVQAAYASGALDDILKAAYATGTPLNHAQVQAEVARAAQEAAATRKLQAETAAIPTETALKEAQTKKALAEAGGPTDQVRNYNFAMAQIPEGQPKPTFEEWNAKQAGMREAETQTSMIQTQTKLQAINQLPDTTEKVEKQLDNLDAILGDPGTLKSVTGLDPRRILTYAPGTKEKDMQERIDMARGSTGVAAVQSLKGVGRILGTEYKAGTEAQSRLEDQGQSYDAYRQALVDVRNSYAAQLAILYQKAGVPLPPDLARKLQKIEGAAAPSSAPAGKFKPISADDLEYAKGLVSKYGKQYVKDYLAKEGYDPSVIE